MQSEEKTSFGLVVVLWLAGLGAAGQFAKVSAIFPLMQTAYPNAGAGLGFLVSALSLLGVGLGLVAGLIVARIGYRRMLLGALILGAVLSVGQSMMPPLPVMMASRIVEGLSHLAIVVAAPTLIAEVTSARHRAAAMTLWSTFFAVAFAVMAVAGVPLAERFGPGAVFAVHGLWMAVIAGLLMRLLPRALVPVTSGPPVLAGLLAQHRAIYASPWQAAPALGWVFYTLAFVSLLTVLPGFLPVTLRAPVAALMPLASIAVSMIVGVQLMRVIPAVHVIISGFVLALAALAAVLILPGAIWPYMGLFGALGLVQGASFAAVPQLNAAPDARARANGAMAQTGNLGNTLGTPLVLLLIGLFGYAGMIGFAAACFIGGIVVHLLMGLARHRRAGL